MHGLAIKLNAQRIGARPIGAENTPPQNRIAPLMSFADLRPAKRQFHEWAGGAVKRAAANGIGETAN